MSTVDIEELGDWGKHLVKEYGLKIQVAESLELEAAELYAHDTRNGWCCACNADIAFAAQYIQDEPEFAALLAAHTQTLKAELLAKTKEAYRKGYNDNARDCLCSGDVPHRHLLDDGKSHNIRPDIKILEEL